MSVTDRARPGLQPAAGLSFAVEEALKQRGCLSDVPFAGQADRRLHVSRHPCIDGGHGAAFHVCGCFPERKARRILLGEVRVFARGVSVGAVGQRCLHRRTSLQRTEHGDRGDGSAREVRRNVRSNRNQAEHPDIERPLCSARRLQLFAADVSEAEVETTTERRIA